MCLEQVPSLWCVYTRELERNVDVGQSWNTPARGIFEKIHGVEQTRRYGFDARCPGTSKCSRGNSAQYWQHQTTLKTLCLCFSPAGGTGEPDEGTVARWETRAPPTSGAVECCSHITSHFLLSIRRHPAMGFSGALGRGAGSHQYLHSTATNSIQNRWKPYKDYS